MKENLPNTAILYDHFHLKMNINRAVDEVRRSEWNKADKLDKKYIPKSINILDLTDSYIQKVEQLNNRPRKRYGYQTPLNKHQQLINDQKVTLAS